MKKIYYSIFVILSVVASACNKIDNYDPPSATLSGAVVDNVTNEPVQNAGVNTGTSIQLFEGNSKQPILSNSFPDGRFVNAALFPGNYKLYPLGAFKIVGDTIRLNISGETTTEVRALPNVRLKATVQSITGTTGTVKVEYEKVHSTEVLNLLGVVWSTIDNPNITTFFGGGQKMETVTSLNLTTGERTIALTGLVAGTKYYIRAVGQTNNVGKYYNYSATIKTP
ncbi:DUF3823 domain-containing protein [Pedobacter heparinus]|uniref:DUF3823 domain-containing protein n=1 Tax=Pedobacter heparinus TaxID=984 RepID=UPI00292DEFD7|nr:DUF3823 domain-containing protein [Pedobacter heparinus]